MSQNDVDVVVVGSCNVDLICYVDRFPVAGETICGNQFSMGCGGKGANQCVMSSNLGACTAMIGCVGDDSFGVMFRENFERRNVNTDYLKTIKHTTTGVAPITVNKQGENSIVIVKGANDCVTKEHVNEAKGMITRAKVALFQLEIDLNVTLHALKLAHEKKTTTIFNPAPAVVGLSNEYLKYTTILCCNETEASLLTGLAETQHKAAVLELLACGPERVVLTLGAKGAMIGERGLTHVQHLTPDPAFVAKAVDTTGAGDCFVGSLAYFLAKRPDLDFTEVVRRSVGIASISVGKHGTQTSYPYFKDLPEHLVN